MGTSGAGVRIGGDFLEGQEPETVDCSGRGCRGTLDDRTSARSGAFLPQCDISAECARFLRGIEMFY